MKKVMMVASIILIIVIIATVNVINIQARAKEAKAFNQQYENYQKKDLYGIDVVTVINKATDNNEKYGITKDEKGMYIEDNENSIKVELNLISSVDEKTGEKVYITRSMERLQEVGLEGFITNFNLTTFRCQKIEYYQKTGKVSKIIFEQVEE